MSFHAVAAYIRTLRQARGYSQGELSRHSGIPRRTIERLEQQPRDVHFHTLAPVLAAVRGRPDHAHALILNRAATADDGRELAESLIATEARQLSDVAVTPLSYGGVNNPAVESYARLIYEQTGITIQSLASALLAVYRHALEHEPYHTVATTDLRHEYIVLTMHAICEDMLHLARHDTMTSGHGRQLAETRSRFLAQARLSPDAWMTASALPSTLAMLLRQLQTVQATTMEILDRVSVPAHDETPSMQPPAT